MTNAEKLANVKIMAEANDADDVLLVYLGIAAERIIQKLYPYMDTSDGLSLPAKYDALQCEIAVYLLNKRGAEGETAHSENGISRSYGSADIPDAMLRGVVPFARVL